MGEECEEALYIDYLDVYWIGLHRTGGQARGRERVLKKPVTQWMKDGICVA